MAWKGIVVEPITIDTVDRVAVLPVEIYDGSNTLIATKTILIPIDDFSEKTTINQMLDLVRDQRTKADPIPLTEQQVRDRVLNLQATVT